ncbi:CCA tRNA nucleotidyltransferase [Granulicella sp. S190]|uniref:CCA tRNA nucleotidyltransferase n=1 Tax=Granulicella sp. S190 TaxID=1747226 RepID=UPI00131DE494|nr:CCA tRNA nucleotidyltransferase [Granulicella sp. S190]
MADYIYLLENRLSHAQREALLAVREVARIKGLTVFLVGGAVRDMTSGSPVRDLDVVVQGNALKLKKDIEKAHGVITGESEAGQSLFVRFPGGVRMEIGSTLMVSYPKPGKPVIKAATILDDLRRRDFTANAMALSLNDGSYGLLMDPLNGVADIENRELRLVSNYGFIEDPVRMIRAARLMARLGWQMDEKTQARYETGKQEGYISAMGEFHRGYETEEIFHEEDPLRVLRKLEAEGWVKHLFPALSSTKANITELEKLRDVQSQLQIQGIHPEAAVANFPHLTAKMAPKEIAALKKSFARQGFVAEIEALEDEAKAFAAEFSGKGAATPSQAWKLLHSAKPESILWVAHTSKNVGIQNKFKGFFTEWAQAKQKLPYTLMQEMRIVPELPGYGELLDKLFFELMDGKLGTVEEMKAYLEPYSPPAPPPPVHLRRPRVAKKDAKPAKSRKKAAVEASGETVEATAASEASEVADSAPAKSIPAKSGTAKPVAPVKAVAKKAAVPVKAAAPAPKTTAALKGKSATKAPGKVAAKSASTAVKKSPAKVAGKTPAKKSVPFVAKKPAAKPAAKKAPAKAPAKKASAKVALKKAVHAKKVLPVKKQAATKKAPEKKAAAKHAPTKKVAHKKGR